MKDEFGALFLARVKSEIRKIDDRAHHERQAVLKRYGLTWGKLNEIEATIAKEFGPDNTIVTQYGTLILNEIPMYLHQNSSLVGYRDKITITLPEETNGREAEASS